MTVSGVVWGMKGVDYKIIRWFLESEFKAEQCGFEREMYSIHAQRPSC